MFTATVAVLSLHFLSLHVASGAPLMCLWLEWRHSRGDDLSRRAAVFLSMAAWIGLMLGAVTGFGLALLVWQPEFGQALERMSYKLWWGVAELGFSLGLMMIVAQWWQAESQPRGIRRGVRVLLQLLAGTNLLYHFPLLLGVLTKVTASDMAAGPPIRAAEFRQLAADGRLIVSSVHFALSSLIVSNVLLVAWGRWGPSLARSAASRDDYESPPDEATRVARWGARWALPLTLVQFFLGLWLLNFLPRRWQLLMAVQRDLLLLFVSAIFSVLFLIIALCYLATTDRRRVMQTRIVFLTVSTVVLMTTLHEWIKPKPEVRNLKPESSSLKSEISNLKFEIRNPPL